MFKHPFRNRLGIARASTPLTPPLSFDLQQLRRRQPNAFERIRGPLLDILGGVALGVTRHTRPSRSETSSSPNCYPTVPVMLCA